MKPQKAIRLGVLLVVSIALISAWVVVAAANGQLATVTANSTGTYNHIGIATVGGQLDCGSLITIHVTGNLQQPVGRKDSVVGSFSNDFSCGPGSPTGWSAQVVPTAGKFAGGSAIFTGSYSGYSRINLGWNYQYYPPFPGCNGPYYDYYNYSGYYFDCYVNGSFGPLTVKLTNSK
jgi:hypothetical protein